MGNVCGKCECGKAQLEKFQKNEKLLKTLRLLIHASGVVCFGYSVYAHPGNNLDVPAHIAANIFFQAMNMYPGKWKYFTVWDVVLQLGYHSIALVNDFCGSSETDPSKQTKLQRYRDALFASWAFPFGLFVTTSFWGLYAIDRKLIFPKEVDVFYPSWLNHAVHTAPAALLALDLLTTRKTVPNKCLAGRANLGFMAVYITWLTYVYKQNGEWAYPVLTILNHWQRIIFFGGSALGCVGFCMLGARLTQCIWGGNNGESGGSCLSKAPKPKKIS